MWGNIMSKLGFQGASGKKKKKKKSILPMQEVKDVGSIPWLGRSPGGRSGNPL